jgi:PadR family transcriptional regulator PadR
MDITAWHSQLRKGAAELVVLSFLVRGESYGVEILDQIGGSGGVLSEGSLYPLLARLERDGKLKARWVMAENARIPRKYYRLTDEGLALVAEMQRDWSEFSAFVSGAVEEARNGKRAAGAGRAIPARVD